MTPEQKKSIFDTFDMHLRVCEGMVRGKEGVISGCDLCVGINPSCASEFTDSLESKKGQG